MNNIFKFYDSTKWQQWKNEFCTDILQLMQAESLDIVVQKAQAIIAAKLSNQPSMDDLVSDQIIQKLLPQQYDKANVYFKIYQNIVQLDLTNYIDLTLPIFALFVAQEELRHKIEKNFNPEFAELLVGSNDINNIFRYLLVAWIILKLKANEDKFYLHTTTRCQPISLLDNYFKNLNSSVSNDLMLIRSVTSVLIVSFFDQAGLVNFGIRENDSSNFIRSLKLINIYISMDQKCSDNIIKIHEQRERQFYKKCNNFYKIINEQFKYDSFFWYSELLFKLYVILCYRQHRCFFRYEYVVSNRISDIQLNLLQLQIQHVLKSPVLHAVIPVLESLIDDLIDDVIDGDNFIADMQVLQNRIGLIESKLAEVRCILEIVNAKERLIRTELLIMELSLINNDTAAAANLREYLPQLSLKLLQLTAIELEELQKIFVLHQVVSTNLLNNADYYNLSKTVLDQMLSKITQYCQHPRKYKGNQELVKYALSRAQLLLEGLAQNCYDITQAIINEIDYFGALGRDEQQAGLNLIELLSKYNQSYAAQWLVGNILRSTQKVSAKYQMSIVYWLLNGVIALLNKLWCWLGGKQLITPINTGADLVVHVEEFLNCRRDRELITSLRSFSSSSRKLSLSIDHKLEFDCSAVIQFLDAKLSVSESNNFINSSNLVKCIDLITIYKKCDSLINKNRNTNNEFYAKCHNFYNKINNELTGNDVPLYINLLHKLYDILLYREHQSTLIYAISEEFYQTQLRLLELQIDNLSAVNVLAPIIQILELLINNFMHTMVKTRCDNFVTVIDSGEAIFIKLIESKLAEVRCILEIVNAKERLIRTELLIMELSLINNDTAAAANLREYLPQLSLKLLQLTAIELEELQKIFVLHQVVSTNLLNNADYYNLSKTVLDQMLSKITQYCQHPRKYKGNQELVKYALSRAQLLLEGLAQNCYDITQAIINEIDYFGALGRDEQQAGLNLIELLSKYNQSDATQELGDEIVRSTQKVSAKYQMSIVYWLLNGVIALLNKLWCWLGGKQLITPINTGADLAVHVEEFLNCRRDRERMMSLSSSNSRGLSKSNATVNSDGFRIMSRSSSMSL